jgi:hypothetical protein
VLFTANHFSWPLFILFLCTEQIVTSFLVIFGTSRIGVMVENFSLMMSPIGISGYHFFENETANPVQPEQNTLN